MDTFQTCNLLAAIPLFLVWGAGGAMCLRWSTRRPVTAMLVGVGVLIAMAREIAWGFRPQVSDLLETLFATAEMRMLALYLTFSIPNTLAWGCVLLAVYRELRRASREPLSASNETL
jgi:hypothetical protein